MKKTFQLTVEGKNRDRVVEAVKHEIRKYIQRERRKDLPNEVDFWDFDCKAGIDAEAATVAHLAELTARINTVVESGSATLYVEVIAKPGIRTAKPAGEAGHAGNEADDGFGSDTGDTDD